VNRRFLGTPVVVLAVFLAHSASAAAVSITFDGRVLRYREQSGERGGVSVQPVPARAPTRLQLDVPASVVFVRGCHQLPLEPAYPSGRVEVHCPLGVVPAERLRYRLSLNDGTEAATTFDTMRGVVYAGKGDDFVEADRVYGDGGEDYIDGRRVYGGPGGDILAGAGAAKDTNLLFGGRGNDKLSGPGWLYGGPGDDRLSDRFVEPSNDMLVGGLGRDVVLLASDGRRDVVRLRGGGTDRVACGDQPAGDLLFVDRADRVHSDCARAHVLLTERPRYP
jgi:Ca2+-binding RTX toxin-like protein